MTRYNKHDPVGSNDVSQSESGTLAARLRMALNGRAVSWLAKETGIPDPTIRNYLRGTQPKFLQSLTLASKLGVRHDWLIANIGPMTGLEELPREPLRGETMFQPESFGCRFITFYDLETAHHALHLSNYVHEATFPILSDWIAPFDVKPEKLWLTRQVDGNLSSVANAGDLLICKPTFAPADGRAYVYSLAGVNQIRRYAAVTLVGGGSVEYALIDDQPDSVPISVSDGPMMIGEVLAVISASPVKPKPVYELLSKSLFDQN